MVDHVRIALEFQRAAAWTYPAAFTETYCTNAIKARAAGCVPVTSALAALNESARCPQAVLVPGVEPEQYPEGYDDAWLEGLQRAVETPLAERGLMATEAIERCSWEAVRPLWEELLA